MCERDPNEVHEEHREVLMEVANNSGLEESKSACSPLATQLDTHVFSSPEGVRCKAPVESDAPGSNGGTNISRTEVATHATLEGIDYTVITRASLNNDASLPTRTADESGQIPAALQSDTGTDGIDAKVANEDYSRTPSPARTADESGQRPAAAKYRRQHRQFYRLERVSAAMVHLTTFEGCPELLRGTLLIRVLKHQGRILLSSVGSAATYDLSHIVLRLDGFISHNWAVPRWPKFLALSYHYNVKIAAGITFLIMLAPATATVAGVLPAFHQAVFPVGICCTLLCPPMFLLLVFFMRDIAGWLGYEGPAVFLDKTCIHQEDTSIQRQGIEKLGAFLSSADEMVVLYSEVYLRRLWTVYEVASFLAVHPISHMKVISVKQAKLFFTSVACISVSIIAGTVLMIFIDIGTQVFFVVLTLLGLGMTSSMRARARERQDIQKRLSDFTVQDCVCFLDSDRPIVYGNIADLMRAKGLVPEDASEEVALQAFDAMVRTILPFAFESSMSRFTFSYKDTLLIGAFIVLPNFFDSWAGLAHGIPMRYFAVKGMDNLVRVLTYIPLSFAVMGCLSSCCLQWRGPREWLVVTLALVVGSIIPGYSLGMLSTFLREKALLSDAVLGAYVLLDVIACTTMIFILLGCCRRRR